MKSSYHQVPNLKGKKEHLYYCKCCVAINLKEDYWKRYYRNFLRDIYEE